MVYNGVPHERFFALARQIAFLSLVDDDDMIQVVLLLIPKFPQFFSIFLGPSFHLTTNHPSTFLPTMGRSKAAVPVRRRPQPSVEDDCAGTPPDCTGDGGNEGGRGGAELLGRQGLRHEGDHGRRSWDLASLNRWYAGEASVATARYDEDEEEDDEDSNSRSFRIEMADDDKDDDDAVGRTIPSGSSSGTKSTPDRPACNPKNSKVRGNRKATPPRKKKKKKKAQVVRFSDVPSELIQIIPRPELVLLCHSAAADDEDNDNDKSQSATAVATIPTTVWRYHPWDPVDPGMLDAGRSTDHVVRSFSLPGTELILDLDTDPIPTTAPTAAIPWSLPHSRRCVILRNRRSLIDVWHHYQLPGSDSSFAASALSYCIEHNLVRVHWEEASSSSPTGGSDQSLQIIWNLKVALTSRALELCHPNALSFPHRRRHNNNHSNHHHHHHHRPLGISQWHPSFAHDAIRTVLKTLVPKGLHSKNSNEVAEATAAVTARQVYAHTDNRQLQHAVSVSPSSTHNNNNENDDSLSNLPGLLPKLRGYQECAVRWMLERERHPPPSDEWELAWVVLRRNETWETVTEMEPEWHFLPHAKHEWLGQHPEGGGLLFFCPTTGWLAATYREARDMTLGRNMDADESSARSVLPSGGILAESMGLGKTVEVLACILANPRPAETWKPQIGKPATAQRRLDFDLVVPQHDGSEIAGSSIPGKVGIVDDMRDFGDADDSSHDGDSMENVSQSSINTGTRPVPITPERNPVPELWVDESVLGSCICGRLVDFSHRQSAGPVIICRSCQEPMHHHCAAFLSPTEMQHNGEPLRYRQRFSNRALDCLVCDASFCPCCVAQSGAKIPSRATLIVTPPAILQQWEREINQHARLPSGDPLKTLVYWGLETSCKSVGVSKSPTMALLHPRHLADADIVLTTFDALVADLNHSDDNRFIAASSSDEKDSFLRRRKRYRAIPSPLLSIDWWRVCLDEAQRVETPTAASARMALKLSTGHRWCVSGTPVGRGKLEDLFGLLLFLRIAPFSCKRWFHRALDPSLGPVDEKIAHLLQRVFWRSTKSSALVLQQMGVPEQVEKKVVLHQSSIERHFYDRQVRYSHQISGRVCSNYSSFSIPLFLLLQLNATISTAGEISDRDNCGKKRKASQLELLADHLHRLRAACCHPQVGSSGISAMKRSRLTSNKKGVTDASGLGSRVMSMDQILDRFIDDAKLKCEEAQRLTVMHTNAMAAIWKLKVQAKEREIEIKESDAILLANSCKLYLEALAIAEVNATATLMVGEVALSGSTGFCFPKSVFRRGSCMVAWKGVEHALATPYADIEIEGPPRKITELRLRPLCDIPLELADTASAGFRWTRLRPKECVLQVASGALNGAFVDVTSLVLSDVNSEFRGEIPWATGSGFRTNKSKVWRLTIKSFYEDNWEQMGTDIGSGVYTALELELFEADIASDPLQRLHGLHNATIAFESLLESHTSAFNELEDFLKLTRNDMVLKIQSMAAESRRIETLYMELTSSTHMECMSRLRESSLIRKENEVKLFSFSQRARAKPGTPLDGWEDCWWDDFLVALRHGGSPALQHNVCDKLRQDLDGMLTNRLEIDSADRDKIKFPEFGDINGFRTALQMRIHRIRTGLENEKGRTSRIAAMAVDVSSKDDPFVQPRSTRFHCKAGQHGRCMEAIALLSDHPQPAELFENSHCHVCKADWFQTGPKCTHCKLGEELRDLSPDPVTLAILYAIHGVARSSLGSSFLNATSSKSLYIADRAKLFFDVLEAEKREKALAYRVWRVHLDLLNDLDELNQCKSSMRLTFEEEDVTKLTGDQLNAVVQPVDLQTRYHDHAGKQAMTLGELRRSKDSLRYLRNLTETSQDSVSDDCAVCQETFHSEKLVAVLRCGHRFCLQPCLEQLKARRSGLLLQCPMRCRVPTDPNAVMIATCKSKVDGSANQRPVRGSWGTKVTRLLADLLDIRDLGEKGVVFSQWEDMLDIVQQALSENGIEFARPSSTRRIGESVRRFRSESTVLLLNVKNGAEGLTLLEATHIFMVEPLLNCGLDSQGMFRVADARWNSIGSHLPCLTLLSVAPRQPSIACTALDKPRRRTCGGI